MRIDFFGPGDPFDTPFFDGPGEGIENLDIVSASATRIVLHNPYSNVTTTFSGTGLPTAAQLDNDIFTGTITGWTSTIGTVPMVTVTGISWPFATFVMALDELYSEDDPVQLLNLFNRQDIIFDASRATVPVDDFDLEGVTSKITFYGSRHGNEFAGGSGNDTITAGGGASGNNALFGSGGNDRIILSDIRPGGGWTELVYARLETSGGITATINGVANTGTITSNRGTDTLVGVAAALPWNTGGFGVIGTSRNDRFVINGGAETWLQVDGGAGADSYDLTLTGDIRLNFRGIWAEAAPTQGAIINLAIGQILNDGYGNAETLRLTQGAGRLEIQGTHLADRITGSDAAEVFIPGGGNDTVDGGGGWDRLRYDRSQMVTGVTLDMAAGTATGSWMEDWIAIPFTHRISNIEELRGTRFGDVLSNAGRSTSVRFDGGEGGDTLTGGSGNDTLQGGAGDDLLNPGDNRDYDLIRAGTGEDMIVLTDLRNGHVDLLHDDLNRAISVTVDIAANTAIINKGANGYTEIIDVAVPALAGTNTSGVFFGGTAYDDWFDISGTPDSWISLGGMAGNDTYNIGADSGGIRLNLHSGSAGVTADLATGVITNDGYGSVDTITGAGRITELRSGNGNDSILGSDASERFILQAGMDTLDGGGGWDTVRYDRAGVSGVTVNLATGTATGTWGGLAFTHTLRNIEAVRGSTGADRLTGDAGNNRLEGRGGNDTLSGWHGDDTLVGGAGDVTFIGGEGTDTAVFSGRTLSEATFAVTAPGLSVTFTDSVNLVYADVEFIGFSDRMLSYAEALVLAGAPGTEGAIEGTAGADNLTGTSGDDTLLGHAGNDWITPGAGNDLVNGGEGTDMVSYIDAPERVVIDLAAGTATVGSFTDRLISIENVTGTIWSDLFTGDSGANRLRGMGGYDWFIGSDGNDTYEGGTGRDTVAYSAAGSGVNASLLSGTGTLGQAAGDRFEQIESLTGSSHKDWLVGSNEANVLRGLGGDDILFGMGGNDTIDGGAGNDWIDGGAGTDRLTGGRGNDTIDGGAGWDTAIYSGRRSDYTVATWSNGWTSVFDERGVDGTDIVMNVEVLQFTDGSLWL